jgi:hypothetical protein
MTLLSALALHSGLRGHPFPAAVWELNLDCQQFLKTLFAGCSKRLRSQARDLKDEL